MERLLITGGAGFIGSNFIRLILAERPGIEVLNFDALTYAGCLENLSDFEINPRYRFLRGDIASAEQVEAAFADFRPAMVAHFAAESHVDRSIADATAFIRTNVLGTQVLLDVARRHNIQRFLHVSTDEVYGSLGPIGRFTEDSALEPNSPYAASKTASDLLVRAAHRTFGFPAIITRGSNNYGPFQFPEKFIPLAIANASTDESIPLYGKGENVRNWIHVEDHCRGILAALERGEPGAVYNLGGEDELDNRSLLLRLLTILGKPASLIRLVTDRPGHDLRYALDSTRAHRELEWQPRIQLVEGLAATVAWYQTHQEWLGRRRDQNYQAYYRRQYRAGVPEASAQPDIKLRSRATL